MWSQTSIMDYAGDMTQDTIGIGVYDYSAARAFYGDVVDVRNDGVTVPASGKAATQMTSKELIGREMFDLVDTAVRPLAAGVRNLLPTTARCTIQSGTTSSTCSTRSGATPPTCPPPRVGTRPKTACTTRSSTDTSCSVPPAIASRSTTSTGATWSPTRRLPSWSTTIRAGS